MISKLFEFLYTCEPRYLKTIDQFLKYDFNLYIEYLISATTHV